MFLIYRCYKTLVDLYSSVPSLTVLSSMSLCFFSRVMIFVLKQGGMEGIMDCKLYWYPSFVSMLSHLLVYKLWVLLSYLDWLVQIIIKTFLLLLLWMYINSLSIVLSLRIPGFKLLFIILFISFIILCRDY